MLAKPLAAASLAASGSISVGEVAGDHAGDMRREGRGRVPRAGGDVERLPGRLRLHQLDQAAEARALGVHGGGGIGRGMRAELLLHEGFGHGKRSQLRAILDACQVVGKGQARSFRR